MRHKWKSIKNKYITHNGKESYVRDRKICVKCGLNKGYIDGRKLPIWRGGDSIKIVIYFKGKEILSKNYLPFKCMAQYNDMLLNEDDFML